MHVAVGAALVSRSDLVDVNCIVSGHVEDRLRHSVSPMALEQIARPAGAPDHSGGAADGPHEGAGVDRDVSPMGGWRLEASLASPSSF